jgi:hypothetical protein
VSLGLTHQWYAQDSHKVVKTQVGKDLMTYPETKEFLQGASSSLSYLLASFPDGLLSGQDHVLRVLSIPLEQSFLAMNV